MNIYQRLSSYNTLTSMIKQIVEPNNIPDLILRKSKKDNFYKLYPSLCKPIYSNIPSLQRGSDLHTIIANSLNGLFDQKQLENEIYTAYFKGFTTYIKPLIESVISVERDVVCHKYRFKGKFDALLKIDNLITLVEWKTTSNLNIHNNNYWLGSHLLQCFAYYFSISDNPQVSIDRLMLCYLMPNGSVCTYTYSVEFMKQLFHNYWISCLERLIK